MPKASSGSVQIVYERERREDAFALSKKSLAIHGLEPHVYSEGEYEMAKETIEKMLKASVVLYPVCELEGERS